jgi:SAM-dependent methyltransferase
MSHAAVLDTATPNGARCYDYLLGGKEAFAADRELMARIAALYPEDAPGPKELAARNRVFLERAVSSAAHDGLRQFLDLGAGFPAPVPLHEVARGARFACVDLDPQVVSHGMAATEGIAGVTYAHSDLTRPGEVMADLDVRSVIDPAFPVAAIFGLTLHFLAATDARRVIAGWADWLAPGSRFVVTVASWLDPAMWERIKAAYGPAPLHNHSEVQVAGMLRGLDILGGGIETARGWGPETLEPSGPGRVLAAVARKP